MKNYEQTGNALFLASGKAHSIIDESAALSATAS